jgi:calcineurin-like phosphoesterase
MVGLKDSSLGVDWHGPLNKFLDQSTGPWEIPDHGLVEFQAVLIEINQGRAISIERITREIEV